MTDPEINSEHSSYYILNREYFSECYDESANTSTSLSTYRLALFLIITASALFAVESEPYIAWFVLCLSGVELLSIRYKRSWWIARQMLSRAAGTKVNIRVDDQGIFTESRNLQQSMFWNDISEIKCTPKGFVICHEGNTRYLSKSGLDDQTLCLLSNKETPLG